MKPIIGINCDYGEAGKHPYAFTYRNYSESVIAACGIPFLLPVIKDKNDVAHFLKRIDGLLLTGGNDVPPQRYGKEQHQKTVCVHPDKDTSDNILVGAALQMKKPILAICYGVQLVNVVLGGSLIQDIPSEGISFLVHKDLRNEQYTHPVTVGKNSLLSEIVEAGCIETNSVHHQAIHELGKGLVATACTSDGVIEAVELDEYPFLLGVQWHPERMTYDPCHRALFSALVKAARQ